MRKKSQSKNSNRIELLGGILNKYANFSKIELEDKAWEMYVLDKDEDYGEVFTG